MRASDDGARSPPRLPRPRLGSIHPRHRWRDESRRGGRGPDLAGLRLPPLAARRAMGGHAPAAPESGAAMSEAPRPYQDAVIAKIERAIAEVAEVSDAPSLKVNERPVFRVLLRPEPSVDGERALRQELKTLLRRCGLRCIAIEPVQP